MALLALRLQQIFDAAAKRAGQSEHGGDGSFAKVFAALLVHLDGAQGNAGAAGGTFPRICQPYGKAGYGESGYSPADCGYRYKY